MTVDINIIEDYRPETHTIEVVAGETIPHSLHLQTLTPTAPVVTKLASVNEWVVEGGVTTAELPPVVPGFSCTVNVRSGFQSLRWPAGTEIVGTSTASSVVLSLIKKLDGWMVLIPSSNSTGGTTIYKPLIVASMSAGNVTYTTGTAALLGPGWGVYPNPHATKLTGGIELWRTGNVVTLGISNIQYVGTNPTAETLICNIPSGYRPPTSLSARALSVGGSGLANVQTLSAGDLHGFGFSTNEVITPAPNTDAAPNSTAGYPYISRFIMTYITTNAWPAT